MPVIRVKRRENPYVQLMRETIRLRDLSLKATGLWTLAMSYPDDWEFNYEHLTKQKTDGEYAFKTAFKELESAGLAALETVRNNDGTLDGKRWTIYEDSSDNPKTTSSVPTDSAVFRPSEKSDVGEITDYGIKNKEDVFTKRISDGETRAREDPVQILRDAWHVRPSPYQQEKITAVVEDVERWRQLSTGSPWRQKRRSAASPGSSMTTSTRSHRPMEVKQKKRTTPRSSSATTTMLPCVPSVTDIDKWKRPASREMVAMVVSYVLTMSQSEVADSRLEMLTKAIQERGYTAAEMALLRAELPFDEELTSKLGYGRPVLAGDFERIVKRSRQMRAKLRSKVTAKEREQLLREHPELDRESFKQCAFDEYKNPLFIYVPEDA